jgi:hypothetical protein
MYHPKTTEQKLLFHESLTPCLALLQALFCSACLYVMVILSVLKVPKGGLDDNIFVFAKALVIKTLIIVSISII